MKIEAGQTALVTGASKGMGIIMARALARRGLRLILAARSAELLTQVASDLRASTGVDVQTIATDLGDPAAVTRLAEQAQQAGGVDILVNNAGLEITRQYDQAAPADIAQMIAVNLTGPMLLTRLLLPGMIERKRGHIVNIASVAGLMASPYQEPYNATKFGLVGFTRSLRLTAQECGWPVSASVICPGFMSGTGMFHDLQREYSVEAPAFVGSISADEMGPALIRAIERDLPDVMLMKGTPRLNIAIGALWPRFFEKLSTWLNVSSAFRSVAKQRGA